MTKSVFISYRREDTGPAAGRIYDRLCLVIRDRRVFFDVSTIMGGENFEQRISEALGSTDAVLAFIGDKWLELSGDTGGPRLWEPHDYVRAELREALKRPVLILPILVDRAAMPKPEQLPEDIRPLTSKNAVRLRHETFDDDAETIVAAILGSAKKQHAWDSNRSLRRRVVHTVLGLCAALLVLIAIAVIHVSTLGRPLSESIGSPATTLLLIAVPIAGALIGLNYQRWRQKRQT